MHPLQKSVINANGRRSGSITTEINFVILENMSQYHPKRKIPIRDHERITCHVIEKESGDIDLNSFLETVDEQQCTTSSMAEFTRFRENVM